jgi:hypothetical protein
MIITDYTIDQNIKMKHDDRKSSGKLSASILGWPTLWQILKNIGIVEEIDEYVRRKFLRGNHVEEWLVGEIKGVIERQKFVEYRDTIGYLDALVDTKDHGYNAGIIPHEVKSVTNAKYRRIVQTGTPDPQHQLQAGFYALAVNSEKYALDYVASDDYRVTTFICDTSDVKDEIDKIISDYQFCRTNKIVPIFKARYEWQKQPAYQNYADWNSLTDREIIEKLKKEFPESYKLLIKHE